jgi:hypothetical protein
VIFRRATHRIHQGLVALSPKAPQNRDAILSTVLTRAQAAAFRELPKFDQDHLCRVYEHLKARGETDPDVLTAGLLHDIGKVSNEGTVRLLHRAGRVLIGRYAPKLLSWLARPPAEGWRTGWALSVHHPEIGAKKARALGCSDTTVWLIAHHEDRPPIEDPRLKRLISVDGCS